SPSRFRRLPERVALPISLIDILTPACNLLLAVGSRHVDCAAPSLPFVVHDLVELLGEVGRAARLTGLEKVAQFIAICRSWHWFSMMGMAMCRRVAGKPS